MDSKLYQTIISKRLPPARVAPDCPPTSRQRWVIVQDNARTHTTAAALDILKKISDNRIYDHPPNSPDFNCMEDAWSYLNRKIKESNIKTIQGLKMKLTQLWNNYDWQEIRRSVDSMPTRLRQCIERDGARTSY